MNIRRPQRKHSAATDSSAAEMAAFKRYVTGGDGPARRPPKIEMTAIARGRAEFPVELTVSRPERRQPAPCPPEFHPRHHRVGARSRAP